LVRLRRRAWHQDIFQANLFSFGVIGDHNNPVSAVARRMAVAARIPFRARQPAATGDHPHAGRRQRAELQRAASARGGIQQAGKTGVQIFPAQRNHILPSLRPLPDHTAVAAATGDHPHAGRRQRAELQRAASARGGQVHHDPPLARSGLPSAERTFSRRICSRSG
jgi:hypothetical protein